MTWTPGEPLGAGHLRSQNRGNKKNGVVGHPRQKGKPTQRLQCAFGFLKNWDHAAGGKEDQARGPRRTAARHRVRQLRNPRISQLTIGFGGGELVSTLDAGYAMWESSLSLSLQTGSCYLWLLRQRGPRLWLTEP